MLKLVEKCYHENVSTNHIYLKYMYEQDLVLITYYS